MDDPYYPAYNPTWLFPTKLDIHNFQKKYLYSFILNLSTVTVFNYNQNIRVEYIHLAINHIILELSSNYNGPVNAPWDLLSRGGW